MIEDCLWKWTEFREFRTLGVHRGGSARSVGTDGMDGMWLVASQPHGMLSIFQSNVPDMGKRYRDEGAGDRDRKHLYISECVSICKRFIAVVLLCDNFFISVALNRILNMQCQCTVGGLVYNSFTTKKCFKAYFLRSLSCLG